jgi:Heparinase II/III-like protein/Heparinase II/III N-terminus
MQSAATIVGQNAPPQLAQRPQWSEVLAHPLRTFHTVRHLQPTQIAYQALRRVQSIGGVHLRTDADRVLLARRPAPQAQPAADVFDGRSFCFLNRRIVWEGPSRWHPAGADDLWIFNLHYHKFLASIPVDAAQRLLLDWMAVNDDPRSPSWHPYPISLRVREWIEWLQAHGDTAGSLGPAMERSIAAQVECLRRRLEFNLLGNHLFENAITLCWAGLSFGGSQAAGWLATGQRLFEQEVRAQLLSDGSHEERSPMYQAQLAEAVLRLAEVAAQSPTPAAARLSASARAAGTRMVIALAPLVHPDGDFALVNDTALGVAPTFKALCDRFDIAVPADHRRTWTLPAGGFSGWRRDGDRYLVFDAGPIGPDHQPGHGHAGALSFELSSRGSRIVTDTGVLTYASGSARRHDRSTAAHNTMEIDGRDQSEVWGAFRCGRRSSIVACSTDDGRDGATFVGAYRGPGRGGSRSVAHERQICVNSRMLAFTDTVTAKGDHRAALRLHLAPGLRVKRSGRVWTIADECRHSIAALASGFDWTESSSPYHPEFGREVARPCLTAQVGVRDRAVAKWWLILR